MKILKEIKQITLAILFSIIVILTAKAAAPYEVTEAWIDESEFPRIQGTLSIEGENKNLLPKHLSIRENDQININPIVLMPPHPKPQKIDLHVLIDLESDDQNWGKIIQANLKSLLIYLNKKNLDTKLVLSTFQNEGENSSGILSENIEHIDSLEFKNQSEGKIDGFSKVETFAKHEKREGSQKVFLIFNGSAFEDSRPDGVTGQKMQAAIKAVNTQSDLSFVMGHPFQKIHQPRVDDPSILIADFAHSIRGGYLGGFATDLSSLGDLLLKQSEDHFVFQYYTRQHPGEFSKTPVTLAIDNQPVYQFSYQKPINSQLEIEHLPENEFNNDNLEDFSLSIKNHQKAINVSLLNYLNQDGIFESIPLLHQRADSTDDLLKFATNLKDSLLEQNSFSYYISAHTPYSTNQPETGLITLPVHIYDDGIILDAQLKDEQTVKWTWSGPTVKKGISFELWSGDKLLTTTTEKNYDVTLNDCNRYQIMQVVVIFEDQSKSHRSRPHEFYVDKNESETSITETEAAQLMLKCLEEKDIQNESMLKSLFPNFSAQSPVKLEKAAQYLTYIITPSLGQNLQKESDYFQALYYIMNFLDKEEFIHHGLEKIPLNKELIYKLITKKNYVENFETTFQEAVKELSKRIRGNLTL